MRYSWLLLWPLAGLVFFIRYQTQGFWLNFRGGIVVFIISLIAGPLAWLALLIDF